MLQLELNNGNLMPILGLGTWKAQQGEVKQAVLSAIKSSYTHIDCASFYGNEKEVGEGINQAINDGMVKREDLFITSKLWNTHHAKEHVREACVKSIQDLQVKYLDLYLIHWPIAFEFNGYDLSQQSNWFKPNDDQSSSIKVKLANVSIRETWTEMEKLVDEGLVKSIGVSNFSIQSLSDLLTFARIKPVVNQVEVHPYLNQAPLIQFAKDVANIKVVGFSPFGAGRLPNILEDEKLKELAQKYNRSTAQIILRWNTQRGVAVIPKSVKEERLKQNIDIFNFELSEEDMETIQSLNRNHRYVSPIAWGVQVFA